ncbi:hypothetical protein ESCAB7627_1626 [Escherichia albertii TW07627]|uniref:Uncharacterized protein n=1 Tax=Escherichia albertii (strain TW07627) TaxID=502347 RepID=A0ABC9NRD6_ESCAT|nr:hypothetical protein ESCAB7627_1626 [Escherichia albertii TW07627]OSL33450.1 hypothetical protein EAPG_02153 [Escherichia albertii B156]
MKVALIFFAMITTMMIIPVAINFFVITFSLLNYSRSI